MRYTRIPRPSGNFWRLDDLLLPLRERDVELRLQEELEEQVRLG